MRLKNHSLLWGIDYKRQTDSSAPAVIHSELYFYTLGKETDSASMDRTRLFLQCGIQKVSRAAPEDKTLIPIHSCCILTLQSSLYLLYL